MTSKVLISLFLFSFIGLTESICPVICVAGLFDYSTNLQDTCNEIVKQYPGTETLVINAGLASELPVWAQAQLYKQQFQDFFVANPDCVNIVAHSLGCHLTRAVLALIPNHPVKCFVHVNGFINGVYSIASLNAKFPQLASFISGNFYLLAYTPVFQNAISSANIFNDPLHQTEFLNGNFFLPIVNNLKVHDKNAVFKASFERLCKFVMLAGTADQTIDPWQSNAGGYYDENLKIVNLTQQIIYTNDTFGLKTIDDHGGLNITIAEGIGHNDFVSNMTNVQNYIIPNLLSTSCDLD